LHEVDDIDMNSLPASYGTDAGDDVELKPFSGGSLHVSIIWHHEVFFIMQQY